MEFEPIGFIKSCFPDKFGTPRQPGLVRGALAELKLRADLQPELALQGLEGFSHLWLIFVFHKNQSARYHAKVHPPRLEGESTGLFSTRTPHRPNPIGLSLVEIVEIRGDTLILQGVDLIDGTPILDIKPYLPEIESKPQARTGWTSEAEVPSITVSFSEEAEKTLRIWQGKNFKNSEPIQQQIEELLKLDPRPVVYRGFEGQKSPYRQEHRVRFYNSDIHFEFTSPQHVSVVKILWPLTDSAERT
jgi:tRNA-Thr(GGU) m(6)t(6)A37 methyltransferase TsaA